MQEDRGAGWIFLTALISGVSIFINALIVEDINPFVFTGLKNLAVGVLMFVLILVFREYKTLQGLKKGDWLKLSVVGLIGGSIPFLLFFKGLQMTGGLTGAFIHKTMFIFVAFFAFYFLKEKIDKIFFVAALLLIIGNGLLLRASFSGLGKGHFLIFLATVFWAVENIISKKLLFRLSPRVVGFGRMFFGSLFILVFLGITGQVDQILNLSKEQMIQVSITSGFLFFYVITWYTGLKYTRVSVASCILLLGLPITTVVNFLFLDKAINVEQVLGILLISLGIVSAIGLKLLRQLKRIIIYE